ncbi:CDP-alcohol phosphatidyltransferase family protein [Pseudohoeflea coraliihabitans]|uniref:CDP-diacylglycerol--glycerol-3-phosphate 3-phosphatidyltransferase n=1 Tax=Pseudohoeflea coraliihabitans TaxID=2860393 RepID=A0ABS6WS27_9HYPH|nr:CDP-alcohol phosphatidyltransferase family protein [Pseudohoeflea sp. DP4N28-3]MBW3098743.1 CDP-alcohol phosphatidyltransferase family protein [Pseudohoeflea sp. DP4N28-3]
MTVPNLITVARFIAVPFLLLAMMRGDMGWAFAIFLIAGISDGIDGFIARRFGQVSELGTYLDPVADKLLLVAAFVMLGYLGALPLWLVLLVVTRDVLIVGAVALSHLMGRPVAVQPLFVSKATTAAQILLVVVILGESAGLGDIGWLNFSLQLAVAGLTIASAAAYLISWMRHMAETG